MDMVIDTNVLVHASNPEVKYFDVASMLVERLADHRCRLAVDEGFDIDEGKNRSLIGGEYFEKVLPGSVAFALLAAMFASGRVYEVPRKQGQQVAKMVNQMLRNKRDRTFLIVAVGSESRIFVSHDFVDFQISKRRAIARLLSVEVMTASDASRLLKAS